MQAACTALGVSRSQVYRRRQVESAPEAPPAKPRPSPARALSEQERAQIREVLNSEAFQDKSPREIYATLLDEGRYLCYWRTMYRILAENDEVRERRNQLQHPTYTKPELLARDRNQLWSWDITKLRGPSKHSYYYLYVILDVYSRYVVGWMIAEQENAELAEQLIAETCAKQDIQRDQLTIHADRGSAMTSKSVALLLSDLGVTKTHSRPHVSNDNPYSEAQFKTLKYRPDYPERFGSIIDARSWSRAFFDWYNNQHHHTAIALLTPADVHSGRATEKLQERQAILQQAYAAHPERFVRGAPVVPQLPDAVWINPPKGDAKPSTDVLAVSDLKPVPNQVEPTANNGSDTFGHQADLAYTDTAGAEDRATLRSDPSADAGDGVAGQGLTGPAHTGQINQLHCQESDKPKPLAATSLALIAASSHHRCAGPASTQHSYTKLSLALSHNS